MLKKKCFLQQMITICEICNFTKLKHCSFTTFFPLNNKNMDPYKTGKLGLSVKRLQFCKFCDFAKKKLCFDAKKVKFSEIWDFMPKKIRFFSSVTI